MPVSCVLMNESCRCWIYPQVVLDTLDLRGLACQQA